MGKTPLVIVLGPTAVGKTEISIDIAKALKGEIISADSMQIYKFMDIGTAKPNMDERQGIPHHLLDIVYPNDDFNVSLYQKHASQRIAEIHTRGKLPIVVGGTGLYINSLIYPLNFTGTKGDKAYRKKLEKQMEDRGRVWLHNKLSLVDPQSANRLHPNDTRRIIRALEVHHITGQPISKQQDHPAPERHHSYFPIIIGLTMKRNSLYDRINKRVDMMMDMGLVNEVKYLLENGYKSSLNSMQGLGYKEIVQYLVGKRTLTEAIYILKRDTRRFAKRQLTWFKRIPNINWVDVDDFESKDQLRKHIVKAVSEVLRA